MRATLRVVTVAILLAGCGTMPGLRAERLATPVAEEVTDAVAEGCRTFTADDFAALDIEVPRQRLGARDDGPLLAVAADVGMDGARERGLDIRIPELARGLEVIAVLVDKDRIGDRFPSRRGPDAVMYWLGHGPAHADATLTSIRTSGGALLSLWHAQPGEDQAEHVATDTPTGERSPHVAYVPVGTSRAALAIGMRSGDLRPVSIFWSDSRLVWQLVTSFPDPVDVVNLARDLACAQPSTS
jgi:hypothetical protein